MTKITSETAKGISSAHREPESVPSPKGEQSEAIEFDLPHACVYHLQQIALADDDMVKREGAAEGFRFIARHILELFEKK